MPKKLLVIAGPTASGKTGLGIKIARQINGEIISADSRMVYQGLSIGTGKPTWEYRELSQSPWLKPSRKPAWGPVYTLDGVDHHLLDIVPPQTRFTLTDWLAAARAAIADIRARGRRPIVVGGTGLYLKALVQGYQPPPTDAAIRQAIEQLSTEEIFEELQKIDPVTAARESNNRRRLIRALEVVRLTGQPFYIVNSDVLPRGVQARILAIDWPREALYRRIDQRTHEQLAGGLIEEVKQLINAQTEGSERTRRVDWLRSIGLEYRIVTDWLLAEPDRLSLPQLHLSSVIGEVNDLEVGLRGAIHAYARRQLTYLRHQLPIRWLSSADEAQQIIKQN